MKKAMWKEYEVLEGGKKNTFKRRILVYFLSIGCPVLTLILLCTFNIWNFRNESSLDNELLMKWDQEFGGFVNSYYFKDKGLQLFSVGKNNFISETKLPNPPIPSEKVCSSVPEKEKFDCFTENTFIESDCRQRGCCYLPSSGNVPSCFFPPEFRSYLITSVNQTQKRLIAEMKVNYNLPFPDISPQVWLNATFVKDDFLLVKISSSQESVELPDIFSDNLLHQTGSRKNALYDIITEEGTVGFQVVRRSTNISIFDSRDIGGFIYSNQFIQISSKLPCKHLYGLGEGRTNMPLDTNWTVRTLWNHDHIPTDGINGYGTYPMYLCSEGGGLAHAAVFLNLYATDFVLQPDAITYRTIGPSLSIAFFLGPTPLEAVQKTSLGLDLHSSMPPYWALGFHLSRFGYKSVDDVKTIWNRTIASGIPYDTQWVDIDYMKDRNDFTLDPNFKNLGSFVEMLHKNGMHFVPILDPGISGSEPKGTYPPYDRGIELDIFVKDSKGKKPLIGKVWNKNSTVFPDFTHPKVISYWIEMLKSFYKLVPFDGLWIDMNEPSNFVNGSLTGCPSNTLEQPPYVPAVNGDSLNYLTLCMSAKHYLGTHYMVHNSYGFYESAVTSFALAQIRGKRPFVISRASNIFSGRFAGHWTGDVTSTWDDLAQSIKDIIHMSMYGVHLVGADICGFNGNATVNLCRRWHQVGAFYPFSRNHNSDDSNDQDPVSLNIVASTKKVLLLRYSLLPYLYTLFWQAKNNGLPVIRPLFYLFPEDDVSYTINSQFMWGDGLLISPVLQEGVTYVKAYLGKSIWYDIYTTEKIVANSSEPYALAAPNDVIPVLIKGGTILVMQEPNVTTSLSRRNPFFLKVALNETNEAAGLLFWDDGETVAGNYSIISFGVVNNTLKSSNEVANYKFDLYINKIEIFCLNSVKSVIINQESSPFNFNSTSKVLMVHNLQLPVQKDFNLTWF